MKYFENKQLTTINTMISTSMGFFLLQCYQLRQSGQIEFFDLITFNLASD